MNSDKGLPSYILTQTYTIYILAIVNFANLKNNGQMQLNTAYKFGTESNNPSFTITGTVISRQLKQLSQCNEGHQRC